MAIGGGDENTRINITAIPKGITETGVQLEALMSKLRAIQTSMVATGNVQGLNQVAQAYNSIGAAAGQVASQMNNSNRAYGASAATMRDLASATKQATAAQAEYDKRYAYGVKADKNSKAGRAKIESWQNDMNKFNMALLGKPENFLGLVNNLRAAKEGLKDVRIAGIATQDSIKALNNPGSGTAFGVPLTKAQQFSAMLQISRKNIDSLFSTWSNQVTQLQWKGRQMIQGVTLPLAGVAISAVNSWASIEKEILSIKKVTDFKGIGGDVDYSNVRKEIRSVSKEYAISEKGAAHAYQEIVQLGVRGAENISGYMKNVMDLSLIGNMDTDAAFQFFRTLKALTSDKPGRSMIDSMAMAREEMAKMNAIADNTSVKLQDLAQAFPEVAPVMTQMGFSVAGIGASLAGMYNRGIPATEAAHGLKFALQRLVSPTKQSKEIIDQLGFSFFNSQGQMSDASAKMFELARQFGKMTDAERAAAAPELFGTRQAARMNSYFNDIGAGAKELDALAAGQIKFSQITSDFLKGLIVTKEIVIPGIKIDEVEDSAKRYDHAVEMFKKDPLKAFERLKVTFKQIYTQLGASLAPMIISVGEKFVGFLEGLQNAPPLLQKIAFAIAAIAVAIGPLKYITAQLAATGLALGKTALALTTKKMVNVLPSQAGAALAARTGGNFMYLGEKTMLNPKAGLIDRTFGKLGFFNKVSGKSRGGFTEAALAAQKRELLATIEAEILLNDQLANSQRVVASATASATVAERQLELQRFQQIAADEALLAEENALIAARNAEAATAARRGPLALAGAGVRKGGSLVAGAAKKTAGAAVAGGKNVWSLLTTGATTGGTGIVKLFGQLATKAGLWGLAIAAVIGVIVALIVVIRNIKGAWASFMKAVQPGIDAIKRGFNAIKAAFSAVAGKIGSVLGELGGAGSGAQAAGDFFSGLGEIVSAVATGIATAMEWIANAITFAMPYFEMIAYVIKNFVGFVASLFQGEWTKALQFFVAALYEIVRPSIIVFDIILKAAAQFISSLLDLISPLTDWIPFVGDGLSTARKALESFSDTGMVPFLDEKLRGLGGIFSGGITDSAKKAGPDANKAGQDLGNEIGDGIGLGVGDSAGGGSGSSWVKSWIDKVVGRIDKEMDRVRKSATEALKKAHEAALKIYDDRVKAIENQEKAEEKLFRTEEYLSKKRELLAKRNLDKQNYLNERAAAVYEGRYNDVRMLDLKEQADKQSYVNDLNGIESDRAKELLQESRDAAKEQINLEKEATQKRLEVEAQFFEDWMALITEYTPLTVGEFQTMTDKINELLVNAGATWPEHAVSAMDRFSSVFEKANADIVDEFRKSGNSAVTAWMESFIGSEELKILKEMANSGGGGGSSGGAGATGAGQTLTAEQGAFLASLATPTPEQLAAWVGTGQGLGGPAEAGSTYVYDPGPLPQGIDWSKTDRVPTGADANPDSLGAKVTASSEEIDAAAQKFGVKAGSQLAQVLALMEKGMTTTSINMKSLYGEWSGGVVDQAEVIFKRGGPAQKDFADQVKQSWKEASTFIKDQVDDYNQRMGYTTKSTVATVEGENTKLKNTLRVLHDDIGGHWKIVNGQIVDENGKTARAIESDNGIITKIQVDGSNEVLSVTQSNMKTAKDIFNDMKEHGIQPGTAAAKEYEDKLRAIGMAVEDIDGNHVLVTLDLDVQRFNARMDYLKSVRDPATGFISLGDVIIAGNMFAGLATGGMYNATAGVIEKFAAGGLAKSRKNGILANIGEGGYDEFVISTDPKYRAQSIGYLSAAAGKLGVNMASKAAMRAASGGMSMSYAGSKGAEYAAGGGGDVYISVDTFIGEEQWFAELANKYNMKTVPRQRKIEGQQKRVVSSYNNRWNVR